MNHFSTLPKLHKISLSLISAIIVIGIAFPFQRASHPEAKFEIGKIYSIPLENKPKLLGKNKKQSINQTYSLQWHNFKIRSGESLAALFARLDLSPRALHKLINTNKDTFSLARLKIGDEISIAIDDTGKFAQLKFKKSADETLIVNRVGNNFVSKVNKAAIDTQVNYASSTITSNFWNAGVNAGLNPNQIMQLANIFAWDIDFALDIREGDYFEVLFEERFKEGENIGEGNILAATFINQGESFIAIRADSGAYYNPQGQAMRKAFLRSPVNFRYVSSNFNPRRLHPVTGQLKAHRGTDYVAPVGTPIWAAGDGIVMKAGYNRFNGNYIFIRHTSTYITKYLHLNKRKVKTGQRIKQGQTIGTLGNTGRVTGPHLHYEFLVNGKHKNPRTVDLPNAKSLSGQDKVKFMKIAKQRLEQLTKFSQLLASLEATRINNS